ncbi:murein biosynthesis integral membrane protein MurJ [Methyloceanibacter sp.]|uniref:murein biosynthesis integral membrane protein MurJ n=1 Tax=Methyloceanibacter sp. TaxID=1965321 RepID=UPI003D6D5FC5
MALYRAFATVGAMTIWSRVLGFVRDVLIAAVLGAGPIADAFFVAFRVPNLFRRLFAEGAFDAAFIPLFAKRFHGEGGEEGARAFAEQALAGLTLALVAFTLLGEFVMPWLMLLLAPGFAADPQKFDLAVLLARIALPFLLCMSLVALYSGVLNALGRFAVAAFAPSLLNVVLILVLLILIALGDVDQKSAAVALAWGIAASGVLQVIVVAVAAAKSKMRLSFRPPRLDADMRRLLALAAPGFIAGGMNQITVVLNTVIASLQDRVVSWFYYADRLFQLPLGVIGVAVGVVLLPELSRRLRSGDHQAAMDSENRSLETALLLTLPAAVALFVAANPIVRVLFERGAFSAIDAHSTAAMLAALAPGLPAFVLIKVFHPGFFAREDTKTPMIFAGIGMAANVMLALLLFVVLGAVGIAIATTIAGWLQAALLAGTLKERGEFALDRTCKRRLPAILAASLIMGAVVWALVHGLGPWFEPVNGTLVQVVALMLLVGSGLAVYAGTAAALGAFDARSLLARLGLR